VHPKDVTKTFKLLFWLMLFRFQPSLMATWFIFQNQYSLVSRCWNYAYLQYYSGFFSHLLVMIKILIIWIGKSYIRGCGLKNILLLQHIFCERVVWLQCTTNFSKIKLTYPGTVPLFYLYTLYYGCILVKKKVLVSYKLLCIIWTVKVILVPLLPLRLLLQ